jgi:hypothetical protein
MFIAVGFRTLPARPSSSLRRIDHHEIGMRLRSDWLCNAKRSDEGRRRAPMPKRRG